MPSGVSAILVTQTILVSALVYWAGSRTKSKASSGVTPWAIVVPSPRTMMSPLTQENAAEPHALRLRPAADTGRRSLGHGVTALRCGDPSVTGPSARSAGVLELDDDSEVGLLGDLDEEVVELVMMVGARLADGLGATAPGEVVIVCGPDDPVPDDAEILGEGLWGMADPVAGY